MRFRFLALLYLLAVGCAPASAAARGTIVILGDSLSSGYGLGGAPSWVTLLQDRLDAQGYEYDVVNASIAGDTSAGGLARLPRLLQSHSPDVVILEMGGNDGLRGQPTSVLRDNLRQMIQLSKDHGAEVLVAGIQIPPNYGPAYTQSLARIYPELSAEMSVALVEFLMDGVALNADLMQFDRVHPNPDGQPVMLENVWPVLAGLLE